MIVFLKFLYTFLYQPLAIQTWIDMTVNQRCILAIYLNHKKIKTSTTSTFFTVNIAGVFPKLLLANQATRQLRGSLRGTCIEYASIYLDCTRDDYYLDHMSDLFYFIVQVKRNRHNIFNSDIPFLVFTYMYKKGKCLLQNFLAS